MAKYRKKPIVIEAEQWFKHVNVELCEISLEREKEANG